MKSEKMLLLALTIGILLLAMSPRVTHAAIIGNTYYFTGTWIESSFQEDTSPVFTDMSSGQFKIEILNVTAGDLIEYNYHGFAFGSNPTNENYTTPFQDNKVYFDLYTSDPDNDSLAESTSITIYPTLSLGNPGRHLLVNPIWMTHDTDWNDAVTDVNSDSTVSSIVESANEGAFTFTIVVNVNGTIEVGGDYQQANGTYTYTFAASYDSNGIALNWASSQAMNLHNENSTQSYTVGTSFVRTSGVGPGTVIDPYMGIPLIYVAASVPIVLIIGLLIGKKMWG
ncbi:MAG: hypothetical protein KAW94_02375 [Candidatus Thorarchaeota archaeon]|nr:hypothetical protein [Candidatus Thorarchaeota archaeon]